LASASALQVREVVASNGGEYAKISTISKPTCAVLVVEELLLLRQPSLYSVESLLVVLGVMEEREDRDSSGAVVVVEPVRICTLADLTAPLDPCSLVSVLAVVVRVPVRESSASEPRSKAKLPLLQVKPRRVVERVRVVGVWVERRNILLPALIDSVTVSATVIGNSTSGCLWKKGMKKTQSGVIYLCPLA